VENTYLIEVTFGTVPHQVYAQGLDRPAARRMRETAVRYGYRDARIVDEANFRQEQKKARERKAGQRRPDSAAS
jgi:hypothetical protein